MLDWLAQRSGNAALADAAVLLEQAVDDAFAAGQLRPMEFGGDQGVKAATAAVDTSLDALLKSRT